MMNVQQEMTHRRSYLRSPLQLGQHMTNCASECLSNRVSHEPSNCAVSLCAVICAQHSILFCPPDCIISQRGKFKQNNLNEFLYQNQMKRLLSGLHQPIVAMPAPININKRPSANALHACHKHREVIFPRTCNCNAFV